MKARLKENTGGENTRSPKHLLLESKTATCSNTTWKSTGQRDFNQEKIRAFQLTGTAKR